MAYAHSQLDGRSPPDPMHEVRFKVKSVPSSPIHHNFTISGSHVRRRPIFNYLEYLDYDLLHIHETVLRGCARDRGIWWALAARLAAQLAPVSTPHVTLHINRNRIKPWSDAIPHSVYIVLYQSWQSTS